MTALTFLRWTRTGAVTAIPETEQQGRAQPRASFGVTVHLQASKPYAADTTVTLYGPSDVIGLDPRQILRRVPEPGTSQASTQVFAHVELDAPDLPWRFTPFAPTTQPDPAEAGPKRQGTLTPWLCLAVVERRDGVTFDYTRGDLLPVLTVDNAARELPDPAAAHAWAHVQLAGAPDTTDPAILGDWIQDHPERTLARLICPRLLDPDTPYLACLIPVYALGAAAGLGQTLTGDPTQDPAPSAYAWSPTATPARLPVYSSWEFVTGVTGSFEDLVRRLQRLDDLGDVGVRDLDVSAPGWGLPTAPGRDPAPLPGALRPVTLPPGWTGDPALVDQLADAVDQVAEVAPPIYGRWHAAVTAVPRDGAHPLWLGQLNLDPGLRVAAGLGAQVVQAEQETFVAAAWAQAGDVLAANRLLRQARAGIAVGRRLHRRHLAPLDPYAQLAVCGPALSRLRRSAGSTSTVHGALAGTCLDPDAFSGAARRVLRTRGPLGRRIARARDGRAFDPAEPLQLLAGGARPITPPDPAPLPAADAGAIATALAAAGLGGPDSLGATLTQLAALGEPNPCGGVDVAAVAAAAEQAADPASTIAARVRGRLKLPAGVAAAQPPGQVDQVLVAPEIPTPLLDPLRRLGPDWILPEAAAMPPNSVGAVAANQAFVEAFLVGANHEMGRELLWRGFPTDQRGTVFGVFWDRIGAQPEDRDIRPIHEWDPGSSLGGHAPTAAGGAPASGDRFVLLLRGDLLARFPGTTIFCVRARWAFRPDGTAYREPLPISAGTVELPLFGCRLDPDIAFCGFNIDLATAQGQIPAASQRPAGVFVVFQEQPVESRFGIAGDVGGDPATRPLASWRDLGAPLVSTVGGRIAGTPPRPVGYLDLAATSASTPFREAVEGLRPAWDARSDSLAAILLAPPFRLYLHATDLVGEPSPTPGPFP